MHLQMRYVIVITSWSLRNNDVIFKVFLAAAEKFASWAAREEVTEEHPIRYIRGLSEKDDFESLSTSNKRTVLDLAFSAYRFLDRLEEILIDSGFSGRFSIGSFS